MTDAPTLTGANWIKLLLLSLLWGGSFVLVEILLRDLPPLTLVTARVALGAALLWAVVLVRRTPRPGSLRAWLPLFAVGLFNNALPFALIVWGQTRITAGLASVFNATSVLFTVALAALFLADERLTVAKAVGSVLGVAGVAVLVWPDMAGGSAPLGQLAVLGAAASYGVAAVLVRARRAWGLSPLMLATAQVSTATVMLLPLAAVVDQPWTLGLPGAGALAALLALGLFSTALAYILYFDLIATAGATNATLVVLLIPATAILLGVAFLGETFTALEALGLVLIVAGLVVVDGRWRRWVG